MAPVPPRSWSSLAVTLLANLGAVAAVKAPNGDVPSAVMGIIVAIAGLVNLLYVQQRHATIRAALPAAPVADVGKVLAAVSDTLTRLEGLEARAALMVPPAQTLGVAPFTGEPSAPPP